MNRAINKKFDKLERVKNSFLNDFEGLSVEQLQFKPSPNSWNMMQVIEHIVSSEDGINLFFKKYNPYESTRSVKLKNHISVRILYLVFWLGIKVKAPNNLNPPKGDEALDVWKKRWEKERAILKTTLDNFPKEKVKNSVFKHPVAGAMNMAETIGFMISHINHHRQQIRRIKKDKNFPKR